MTYATAEPLILSLPYSRWRGKARVPCNRVLRIAGYVTLKVRLRRPNLCLQRCPRGTSKRDKFSKGRSNRDNNAGLVPIRFLKAQPRAPVPLPTKPVGTLGLDLPR
jgi:hypothetical protein